MDERFSNYLRVMHLLSKYSSFFDDFEKRFIRDEILHTSFPDVYFLEFVREVLDEVGLIPDNDNIYLAFLSEIENAFGICDRNILEVGGGRFPCLGRRIHHLQKNGSITVYDPLLIPVLEGEANFVLRREKFMRDTSLKDINLMVGLMPCKGAEELIFSAIQHRIDFMVWLCEGGAHGDYFDYFEDEEEWRENIIYEACRGVLENSMGVLKTKKLTKFSSYPILYNYREK